MQRVFLVGTFDSQIALAIHRWKTRQKEHVVLVKMHLKLVTQPESLYLSMWRHENFHEDRYLVDTGQSESSNLVVDICERIRVFSLPCRMQTHTEHVVTRLLLDTSKMAIVWWKCTRIRGSLSWTCCIPFAQNFAASIKQRTTCASRVTASKVNESSWTCDSLKLSLSHTSVFYLWKEQLPLLVVVQTKTTKCARIWIALQTNSKGLHMRIQNAVKGPTHV